MAKRRMQPIVAMKAMGRLLRNPEATEEVFVIVRALAGDAIERGLRRFRTTPHAERILGQQQSLLDVLANREYLRGLPEGSLGRTYLKFMEDGNITAEGLKAASDIEGGERFEDPELEIYGLRLRDQHDLWHAVSGYGRDVAGEACLLAFTYAQTKNRGIGFIAFMGALKLRKTFGNDIFASMNQAYKMGKSAAWLPAQMWEDLLELPVDEVRRKLNLAMPDRYTSLPLEMVAA